MTLQAINPDKIMALESKLQYFTSEAKLKQVHFKEDKKVLWKKKMSTPVKKQLIAQYFHYKPETFLKAAF